MTFIKKEHLFFWFVLILLFSTDIFIIYQMPVFQQIFGFILIGIIPGFLLLNLLKIQNLEFSKVFVLSVGLSVAFIIFFGLAINTVLPLIGLTAPLALIPLLTGLNICIILFTGLLIYRKDRIDLSLSGTKIVNIFQTNPSEKITIILFLSIFSTGLLGIYLLNNYQNNSIMLIFFILIALTLLSFHFLSENVNKRFFPFFVFILSISLLLLLALRSNYLIGYDTHEEFFFFKTTLNNFQWNPEPGYLLSSTIDISIFPTVYAQILNLNPLILFKVIYSIIFSITPVVIYLSALKYVKEIYAFFISCFFMFQELFFNIAANSRTSIALLCFALLVFILFETKIQETQRKILFIVFFFTCVVSSYSTTYIIFFLLLITCMLGIFITKIFKIRLQTTISIVILLVFFTFMALWYEQVITQVARQGVIFSLNRIEIYNDFLQNDLTSYSILSAGSSKLFTNHFSTIGRISRYLLFGLIALGLFVSVIKYLPYSRFQKFRVRYSFFTPEIDLSYLLLSTFCAILFFILVFANYFFIGLGIERLFQLLLIVLSLYLVIGLFVIIDISKIVVKTHFLKDMNQDIIKNHLNKKIGSFFQFCLILLLIIQLFDISGISYQMAGYQNSILLNPPNEKSFYGYNQVYVYDQDAFMANWIKKYFSDSEPQILADTLEKRKISSLSGIRSTLYSVSIFESSNTEVKRGYVVFGLTNNNQKILIDYSGNPIPIKNYLIEVSNKPLIYNNGGLIFGKYR